MSLSSSTRNALRAAEEKSVSTTDPYGNTDRLDETSLEVIVLALAAAAVLVIVLTYKKGERITRDPFEEE